MKAEIKDALAPLLSLPLWGIHRLVQMGTFQFGEHRQLPALNGGHRSAGTWSLHISCAWRIRQASRIIVSSSDYYMRADHLNPEEDFDYDVIGANQRDQRVDGFMNDKGDSLVVTKIDVGAFGDFRLELASRYRLEVFSDFSVEDFEYWRVFQVQSDLDHFVVCSTGIFSSNSPLSNTH